MEVKNKVNTINCSKFIASMISHSKKIVGQILPKTIVLWPELELLELEPHIQITVFQLD